MEKPSSKQRYLNDWDEKLSDDWVMYAQTSQSSHCRNINAHEKGARYTEDLFHRIDELVLMHAFGAAAKQGAPHSDLKKNFSPAQCSAAEKVRSQILKYGKIDNPKGAGSTVSVQVISVTLMLVECPKAPETPDETKPTDTHAEAPKEETETPQTAEKKLPGVAQVAVFRVVKPDDRFCFIDHTSRKYDNWNDYVNSNKLPRCKMCFPRDGVYKYKQVPSDSTDENNNETLFALDLTLAESNSCSTWERTKDWTFNAVSIVGTVVGLVAIVAAPFTGSASVGAYATIAVKVAGWVSFGCMIIGTIATLGSLWDKYWHDESYTTELLSLAMVVLQCGVTEYNAKILRKVKGGVAVTRMELTFMTVLNCVPFGVQSIVFVTNCVRLVMKACDVGLKNITAEEWLHFAKSAHLFGKTVFEPKTGYRIIKEARLKYTMQEKRVTIKYSEVRDTHGKFLNLKKSFGDAVQGVQDDWKGFTCSREVCDELNGNGALIQNINSISDLAQFFLKISDTNPNFQMTTSGKVSMNGAVEMYGNELENFLKVIAVVPHRRGRLLGGSRTSVTQTTTTECTVDDQPQPNNENTRPKQSANKTSGFGKMKVKDMRSGLTPPNPASEMCAAPTTTETAASVKESVPSAKQSYVDAIQSVRTTMAQVYRNLLAARELEKRQKIYPGTTSDDDYRNECICRSVKIPVLYANMRSINPKNRDLDGKIAILTRLVNTHQPQLIAIVESWLQPKHTTKEMLDSLDPAGEYEAFRHDRADGHDPRNAYGDIGRPQQAVRGGGVLVLWKKNEFPNVSFKRSINEDFADNIVNFDMECTFNCAKCHHVKRTKKFIFTVIYRRPSPSGKEDQDAFDTTTNEVVDRLANLNMSYDDDILDYSGIAIVGDFNWRDANKLQDITEGSNCLRVPLSSAATHEAGGALDQVISSPWFVVNSMNENLPLVEVTDSVSEHAALVFSLHLGKDSKPKEECKSLRCF